MSQYLTPSKTSFVKITQGDADFMMTDGITLMPRANIEISDVCPSSLKMAIHRAMADGYIKCVAHVKEKDYMWEKIGG